MPLLRGLSAPLSFSSHLSDMLRLEWGCRGDASVDALGVSAVTVTATVCSWSKAPAEEVSLPSSP